MTKILKVIKLDSTNFLEMGERLGYGWNESNGIIYDTLIEYLGTELYSLKELKEHIYDEFSRKDKEKLNEILEKNERDTDKAGEEIYELFKRGELNYIPYFHIIYSVLKKYLDKLEKGEIDGIIIISD